MNTRNSTSKLNTSKGSVDETKQLRKENQDLRKEIDDLKAKIENISKNLAKQGEQPKRQDEKDEAVDFLSDKFDDLSKFKDTARKEIQQINSKVNMISHRCDEISKSLEAFEAYSYQYNIKIVGMPMIAEFEDADTTANLCIKLFHAMGVKEISLQDIDIAHRVPARRASSQPKAIICKFVRRLARNKVMAARKNAANLQANQFGFTSEVPLQFVNLYDHLTPRLQSLLFEAKTFSGSNNFKFCWTKNGYVNLRKTDSSEIIKLATQEDLNALASRVKS